jgi:hypothetical protein
MDLLLEKCFLTSDNLWLNLDAMSCADDRFVTERACCEKLIAINAFVLQN